MIRCSQKVTHRRTGRKERTIFSESLTRRTGEGEDEEGEDSDESERATQEERREVTGGHRRSEGR